MGDGQTVNGHAKAILAVSSVFSLLAILCVVLRFVAKHYKKLAYTIDDWLIVIALIVTLGVTINNIIGVAVAGLGEQEYYRTDPVGAGFPYPRELLPQGQVMFALQILHTCAMPIIKASVLTFYLRVFQTSGFRIAVWCVAAYVFCWWISILFATIFQCNPISDNWGTQPNQMSGCLPDVNTMYQVAAVTNMASDVAILALPFPIVIRLHLLRKHKIAVLGIFMTGAVVVVAGIGRTVAYFQFNDVTDYNFSNDYYPLVIWTSLEPTLGVIGACLPVMRPLFAGFSPESVLGSIRSVISLHSFRSGSKSPRPNTEDDKVVLNSGVSRKPSAAGFVKMPEQQPTMGPYGTNIELGARYDQATLPAWGIVVDSRISLASRRNDEMV